MSDSPNPLVGASPPFDHAKADVILRSSDGTYFRVFKVFLSVASPFFETLFGLPQPSEETNTDVEVIDGLPVIPVSEDSRTLDLLLRFCYPCTLAEDPALEDFEEIVNVLEAAKKYSLDGIERTVCRYLFQPNVLEANSLRCFAIACRARMRDECVLAAKYTLREPLVPEWFEEIELIASAELLSLLAYHRQCSDALLTLNDDLAWITDEYHQWTMIPWMIAKTYNGNSCNCPRSARILYGSDYPSPTAQWWEDFMNATFLDFRDKPCAETIRINVEKAIHSVRQRNCKSCIAMVPAGLRDFSTLLTNKLEELTSKVSFY
ncbi:hypothetical protein EDC04DRAFT_1138327 [Pisolithus marmoratus]|nr:hypothetical protein EDC04DRAFT_1138327 [Pisolithus marmoratus]